MVISLSTNEFFPNYILLMFVKFRQLSNVISLLNGFLMD